jgi:hypothetical protein
MSTTKPLYLNTLPQLDEIFSFLNSGRHMNRLADPRLWVALEREREAYEQLFGALGYVLRIDERGYAWFYFDEASSSVSKMTRQLALLFMLIFEFQADAGLNLRCFTDWLIDDKLLAAVLEKNRLLLEAEGLAEQELVQTLLRSAGNYGFVVADGNRWRLLPAVFRYLDRFEELANVTESRNPDVNHEGEAE